MSDQPAELLHIAVALPDADSVAERIRAIAPERLRVIPVFNELIAEMATDWPERMMQRNAGNVGKPRLSPEELAVVLQDTHVMLMGAPFPRFIRSRMPRIKWAHFNFAGITNLKGSDWWGSPCTVTSSRGYTGARPIAEAAVAGAMMLAKRLDLAVRNSGPTFDPDLVPEMLLIEGKTMGIVGLGGIGSEVAKMARGLGMSVLATRHSARQRQSAVNGVHELYPPSQTEEMLAECDFVAICAIWTPETEGMFSGEVIDSMKNGAILINVARGELVDEEALIAALSTGKLRGAYLDVWPNDYETLPNTALLDLDNVVITPHIAWRSDVSHRFGIDLFCSNLGRMLDGIPMINVVNWERGY